MITAWNLQLLGEFFFKNLNIIKNTNSGLVLHNRGGVRQVCAQLASRYDDVAGEGPVLPR